MKVCFLDAESPVARARRHVVGDVERGGVSVSGGRTGAVAQLECVTAVLWTAISAPLCGLPRLTEILHQVVLKRIKKFARCP